MNTLNIVTIESIKVASVKSTNGPQSAGQAFMKLERRMTSLRGRKMYGLYYPKSRDYYAGVKIDNLNQSRMGLEECEIPYGKYARFKIKEWGRKIHDINLYFKKLINLCKDYNYIEDFERPEIEFYRSQKELIVLLPVKPLLIKF
jgi:predicted transcriptional regulator YdeE